MIDYLVGILETGGPPDRSLPASAAHPVRMSKGQDVTLRIQVLTRSGIPVDLSPVGTTLTLTLRRKSKDAQYVAKVAATVTEAGAGKAEWTVAGALTLDAAYDPGLYVWDAWLTRNGSTDPVVPLSAWFILPAAFRP